MDDLLAARPDLAGKAGLSDRDTLLAVLEEHYNGPDLTIAGPPRACLRFQAAAGCLFPRGLQGGPERGSGSVAHESKIAVYGALAGNLAIAVTKFVGASITGSSAMLSEGIHSTVDTADQVLLLVGMHRAARPPDPEHPFGHGKELYFWGLIVAVLIFGAGGGISAYEGILHILHPTPLSDPTWSYVVLGLAFVFEGGSFLVALRAFLRQRGSSRFWTKLRRSKDPTIFTVLAEDSAALAGIVVAFAGIFASHQLRMPVLDGAASVVIGLILASVAVVLVARCRGLLVGEGVRPEVAREIREIAAGVGHVQSVSRPLTMYFGPDDILLMLDVRVPPETSARDLARSLDRMKELIQERFPGVQRISIEVDVPEGQPPSGAGPRDGGGAAG